MFRASYFETVHKFRSDRVSYGKSMVGPSDSSDNMSCKAGPAFFTMTLQLCAKHLGNSSKEAESHASSKLLT